MIKIIMRYSANIRRYVKCGLTFCFLDVYMAGLLFYFFIYPPYLPFWHFEGLYPDYQVIILEHLRHITAEMFRTFGITETESRHLYTQSQPATQ